MLSPSSTDYLTAQQQDSEPFSADGIPVVELPTEPVIYRTAEHQGIKVTVVAKGLTYPWGLAFLPDGTALITERLGTLRMIKNGVLADTPISGVPKVFTGTALAGLMDVAIHPQFSQNRWVYLTYSKATQ